MAFLQLQKASNQKRKEKKAKSVRGKAKYDFKEESIDLQGSAYIYEKRRHIIYWDRKQVGDNKTMVF